MRIPLSLVLAGGLAAVLGAVALSRPNGATQDRSGPRTPTDDREPAADRKAIEQSGRDFSRAFAQRDARAVAALWTEHGEMEDADGRLIRGRAAIEKAFAELFKADAAGKLDVVIETVRFPAAGVAIEEGILRRTGAGRELPSTTHYSAVHAREAGKWKIAATREWGAGQDRLADLDWLVGRWKATFEGHEVTLSFARNANRTSLTGQFTRTMKGKTDSSGTMRIAQDPQTGQLRSWHFDEDGGYGQAVWLRDGDRWVLDSVGVLADGTETHALNLLGRIDNDTITWRSIDRMLGDRAVPDTVPIKLRRVPQGK